jgi:hypothetical protein
MGAIDARGIAEAGPREGLGPASRAGPREARTLAWDAEIGPRVVRRIDMMMSYTVITVQPSFAIVGKKKQTNEIANPDE